jgi:nicotinate-nucleotide pyrophosphorylase (carboxylating)
MTQRPSEIIPEETIKKWLEEDIREGDHTTLSIIPRSAQGITNLLVKENGIIAGIDVAIHVFQVFDPSIVVEKFFNDGDAVVKGDIVFKAMGPTASILQTERLILNIMQRMSGIASTTRSYVNLLQGLKSKILDTRKTTPGFRLLEKEAVRLGGGVNHRFGLYDMILIKDNHIDFAGGIDKAIHKAQNYLKEKNKELKIEVEARNLRDIETILRIGGVDRIMLDNFSIELTREAVALINGRVQTESSGNITSLNIRAYAECGVDYISVGALTHHIKSLDLSLKAQVASS